MARRGAGRGLTPVVGTTLMIAIVLVFAAVAGYVFLGLSDTSDPGPQVVWEAESSEDRTDWRLVHGGGDRVDGGRLELHGTANPDVAAGTNLSAEDEVSFYPTSAEVGVVWYGDDGESYRLTTIEVEQPLPEPDEGCDWMEDNSDNGSDEVTVDGLVVNCDVSTADNVHVENGGAVVGEVISEVKVLDLDDAAIYGDVEVFKVANVQNGTVTGDVTSEDEEVKLDETTVEGSVTAADSVDLDDATVEGHVYVDPSDLKCTNSTIDGEDCGSYEPRDPDDW